MSRVSRAATSLWKGLPNGISKQVTAAYFKANSFYKLGRNGYHSCQSVVKHQNAGMRVRILPALSDNYMYLIIDETTQEAAIVDPVAPETVFEAVKTEGVNLTKVLTTHHHWDHAGGNKKMAQIMPQLSVYGGDDRIDALTHKLHGGEDILIGRLKVKCLFTPCHTTGHICYFVTEESGKDPAVFTGDTLFLGGCGRFFEGNAEQMNLALNQILYNLPDHTKVYCGHEYAIQNLSFGLHVEPENQAIIQKLAQIKGLRASNPPQPSVPSTIGEEKLINPFMRVNQPALKAFTGKDTDVETMKAIRTIKDNFKTK